MNRWIICIYLALTTHPLAATDTWHVKCNVFKPCNDASNSLPTTYHKTSHKKSGPHTSQYVLYSYSYAQLMRYFAYHNYSQENILSQDMLYCSPAFIPIAKTCEGYEAAITELYHKITAMSRCEKIWHWFKGDYCVDLENSVTSLYAEKENKKNHYKPHHSHNIHQTQPKQSLYRQQELIAALESKCSQTTIATMLRENSHTIFDHVIDIQHTIDSSIEDAVSTSLDILHTTENAQEFVFHTAFVDRILSDIDRHPIPDKPTLLERSPALLAHALTTFVKGLNPLSQIKNTGEFIVNIAHFSADVTLGKLYLSNEHYDERIQGFWKTCQALSPSNLAMLEAEQWVDLAAQCAADVVFFGGVSRAVTYLKEIKAVDKAQQHAHRIAKKLKQAVDASLKKQPLLVTAEGYIMRASNEITSFGSATKEIITDSRAILESACKGFLAELEKEMAHLRMACDNKVKGFAECANKYLKPKYEHILGINPIKGRFGISKISGFHHDFNQSLRNSGIFQFIDKIKTHAGFYKSEIYYQGQYVDTKTFFPAHWPRKKVIEKIYEAYENSIASGLKPHITQGGKYLITGLIKEGIEIEMYITKKGHICTAYPIMPQGTK